MKRAVLIIGLLFVCPFVFSQEKEKEKEKPVTITGMLFGDYYFVAASHDPELEGKNGFWVRRAYLTFDRTLSDQFSARLRFEVSQPGDFETSANMEPFVKDAYIRWKRNAHMDVTLGISPSPTWETVERVWGYRSVERTPVDLYRLGSSRDFGVAVSGAFGAANRYRYHVQAGNGSGTGSETNEEKKISAAFSVAPTKATLVEVYADRDSRPGEDDRTTLQAFAALQREKSRFGIQFVHQDRAAQDVDLASVFAVFNLREDLAVLGRVDRMFDPTPEADRVAYLPLAANSKTTLLLLGVDYKAHPSFSIIPNVEYVHYDENLDAEIVPRVTFFYSF